MDYLSITWPWPARAIDIERGTGLSHDAVNDQLKRLRKERKIFKDKNDGGKGSRGGRILIEFTESMKEWSEFQQAEEARLGLRSLDSIKGSKSGPSEPSSYRAGMEGECPISNSRCPYVKRRSRPSEPLPPAERSRRVMEILRTTYPLVNFAVIASETFDEVKTMHLSNDAKKEEIMKRIIQKTESSFDARY